MPKNLTDDHLIKTKRSVADLAAFLVPVREWIILGDFGCFWSIQAGIVAGESRFDLEIPSYWVKNKVIDYKLNSYQVPCQSRKWAILGDFGRFLADSGHYCSGRHFVI